MCNRKDIRNPIRKGKKSTTRQSLGITTGSIVLAIILVIVVATIGVIAFASHSGNVTSSSSTIAASTSKSTSTISAQMATTVSNPTNGLELRLFLNASSASATGVNVSLFADVYNPSSSTANVTSANDWVVPLNWTDGVPCGDLGQTVGFAIAKGYYTTSNATEAKLLDLVNPGATYNCPAYFGYGSPTGDLFQPMSDSGTSYGCVGVSPCLAGLNATATYDPWPVSITGYYGQGGTFTTFQGGTYTVLAEDEWGALALAYFSAP